jgi:hypothetical protein
MRRAGASGLVYVTGFLPRDDSLVRICSVDPNNPLNASAAPMRSVTVTRRGSGNLHADCPDDDTIAKAPRSGAHRGHVPDRA